MPSSDKIIFFVVALIQIWTICGTALLKILTRGLGHFAMSGSVGAQEVP